MDEKNNMMLTYVDRMILESYKVMLEGLSEYLGSGYEFVLHSLDNYDHSVIKIINGFHTGRAEGAPITNLALSMLEKLSGEDCRRGSISYHTTNKNGEPLKSCTITIVGENQRIIGLLCINFYLNTAFNDVLTSFVRQGPGADPSHRSENFADNIDDIIISAVNEVRQDVFSNNDIPTNCKNKEIVHLLSDRGIFKLKDSVVKTAEMLNISKNTVYMHIRNLGEQS